MHQYSNLNILDLKHGPLFVSLIKRLTQSWDELLPRTYKFIHLEDAILEKYLKNTALKAPSMREEREGRKLRPIVNENR